MANKRDISEQIPHYLQFGWLAFRPKWLKLLNSPKWFLFFLVMYFFTQSIVVNGVYSVSISTIEKRYGYSSSLTGFLTSSFDIAALVLTPLVSFLGARRKKPVWCGVGLLTMGIGMLIFFLPHVFSGRYEAGAESESGLSTGLCNSTSVNSCEYTSGNKGYVPLFVLGMLVMGSGATPMIALGIPYMDENVKAKASPMYVGIFYASGLLGAGVGFIVSGKFLAIYVDIGVETSLTPTDERWIGAWWLGFVICGTLCIFWSIWLFGYPKRIPGRNDFEKPPSKRETTDVDEVREEKLAKEMSQLQGATKDLLKNVAYVFTTLSVCMDAFLVAGFIAFAPKILQSQFSLPASKISILFGLTVIPGAVSGNLSGAYINKRLRLSMTGAALMCMIGATASALGTIPLLASCTSTTVAGVKVPYINSSSLGLQDSCNAHCACSAVPYSPVCSNDVTYFSPCHAGCLTQINGSLAECSCLLPSSSRDIITMGKCRFSCGYKYGILLGAVFLFGFFTFMNMTPATTVTLRCLPVDRRTYGLGFQMTMTRLLGAIPGPIAFGTLIDWNCILWDRGCDDHGNCLEYNNTQLAYTVFGLCFVCKLVTTLSYFVAFVYCRKINRSLAMGVDTAEMSGAVVSGITNESLEIEACVKTETTTHL